MTQEPVNAESPLEEQLVAYLDGELDGEACRRIEERLAVDPAVRRKLHDLERAWELLDELDTAPVGEDFTRTTLEMVAMAAEEDVRKNAAVAPRRRRLAWFLFGVGIFLAGAAGFTALTLFAANTNRDNNRELVRDLPVLADLEEYRVVQDIDFLRLLRQSGLFAKGYAKDESVGADRSASAGMKGDPVKYIQSLTPDQKDDLRHRYERFAGLDADMKNRLRKLHDQIQNDKHSDELRAVMNRYYEWYRLLPTYSRPELILSADQRMDQVKELKKKEQTEITFRPPTVADSDTLWNWVEEFTTNHEADFIKALPEGMQKNLSGMDASARRRYVMGLMWLRLPGGQSGQSKDVLFSEDDLNELLVMFTPGTQVLLDEKTPAERIRIIQNWAHTMYMQQYMGVRPGQGPASPINDKVLAEFFEKGLTPEERNSLMNLSSDDMQQHLMRLYISKNRPSNMFPYRGGDFRQGPPPGEDFDSNRRPHM